MAVHPLFPSVQRLHTAPVAGHLRAAVQLVRTHYVIIITALSRAAAPPGRPTIGSTGPAYASEAGFEMQVQTIGQPPRYVVSAPPVVRQIYMECECECFTAAHQSQVSAPGLDHEAPHEARVQKLKHQSQAFADQSSQEHKPM